LLTIGSYLFSTNKLLWIGDNLLNDFLRLVRDENERPSLILNTIKRLFDFHDLQKRDLLLFKYDGQ